MEFEKLQAIISEAMNIEPSKITLETKFIDDLGADSLDLFQIILALEDEYGISISDDQAEGIITVEDAVEAMKKQANE